MRVCEKGHLVASKKCWCGSSVDDVLGGRKIPLNIGWFKHFPAEYAAMRNFRGATRRRGSGGCTSPRQAAMSGGK